MSTSRAERAASTRGKLLDAAVQLFVDKPYDEVSVHDLANAAGVAYGLVAHHFGNKRGIHLEAMRQIARQLTQAPPPPGPPAMRIRHLIRDHLAAIEQNPTAYLGLMLSADPDSRAIIESGKQLAVQSATSSSPVSNADGRDQPDSPRSVSARTRQVTRCRDVSGANGHATSTLSPPSVQPVSAPDSSRIR